MEIKGVIVKVMEVVSGNGAKPWSKQEFLLETPGQYPKKVCMNLWGTEAIYKYDLKEGLAVTAHINLESREYNGRYYTDVRCWKLEWDEQDARKWQNGGKKGSPADDGFGPVESTPKSSYVDSGTDDLPF